MMVQSTIRQCDQIVWFFKVLFDKFSYKNSPKYFVTFGAILKNINFSWQHLENFRNFLFKHLVTLKHTNYPVVSLGYIADHSSILILWVYWKPFCFQKLSISLVSSFLPLSQTKESKASGRKLKLLVIIFTFTWVIV